MSRWAWLGGMAVLVLSLGAVAATPHRDCDDAHGDHRLAEGASLETVSGTVVKIDRMEKNHMVGRRGLHLTLRAEDGSGARVHLCPCRVLLMKGMVIRKKDVLRVRGFPVDVCGTREWIGVEVTKDGRTVWLGNPQAEKK